jgi:hypothetical protein
MYDLSSFFISAAVPLGFTKITKLFQALVPTRKTTDVNSSENN